LSERTSHSGLLSSHVMGLCLAAAAAILWGLGGVAAQELFDHHDIDPRWLVSVRMIGAGLLLLAVLRPAWPRHRGRLVAVGILGMAAPVAGASGRECAHYSRPHRPGGGRQHRGRVQPLPGRPPAFFADRIGRDQHSGADRGRVRRLRIPRRKAEAEQAVAATAAHGTQVLAREADVTTERRVRARRVHCCQPLHPCLHPYRRGRLEARFRARYADRQVARLPGLVGLLRGGAGEAVNRWTGCRLALAGRWPLVRSHLAARC
jgi:EamA-like transporter family